MRFRNVSVPALLRIIISASSLSTATSSAQISTAEGDQIRSKALPVNITGSVQLIAYPIVGANANGGATLNHKLIPRRPPLMERWSQPARSAFSAARLATWRPAVRYLKLYNKATAPTVGTDTPIATIALQPNTTYALFDLVSCMPGAYFTLGIGYGLTTGQADNDTGALTAGDVVINIAHLTGARIAWPCGR